MSPGKFMNFPELSGSRNQDWTRSAWLHVGAVPMGQLSTGLWLCPAQCFTHNGCLGNTGVSLSSFLPQSLSFLSRLVPLPLLRPCLSPSAGFCPPGCGHVVSSW